MEKLERLVLILGMASFLAVGILLFTGHAGFAVKISNYLFFILTLGIVLNYFSNE